MNFDKAGNAEDLDNEKLQLICKAYNRELLSNHRVVDGINSMDYSKLKILCKYNNKLSHKGIEELLSDKEIVDNINDYDDEMFRSMINHATSEHNILEILKGGEVCNTNNEFESSDSEENEEDYGYYDNSDYEEDEKNDLNNFAKEALGNKGTNEKRVDDGQFHNINHVIFIYMLKSNKFTDKDFTKLYDNKEILERINSVTDERFELILSSNKFDGTSIIELLDNQNAARNIDLIDKETLKYIIENDKFSLKDIIKLLENQEVVKRINSMNSEIFNLIFKYLDKGYIMNLLKYQSLFDQINSLDGSKVSIMISNNFCTDEEIVEILKDQSLLARVNSIDLEKLELISNSSKFDRPMIMDLLKSQNFIDSINTEKFRLLLNSIKLHGKRIITLLKDQNAVKHINSVTNKELKAITDNVTGKVFISIFKNFEPSVKSTLRFVIPLFRAGRVRDINIDYLNNKNSVYNDIIEHLYSEPNIELLIKHFCPNLDIISFVEFPTFEKNITCEEPVSKLYNLSLEQVIENINSHKRARYF